MIAFSILLCSASVICFIAAMIMFAFWDTMRFFNKMKRFYRLIIVSMLLCGLLLPIDPHIALANFILLICVFYLFSLMGVIWKYM